MEEGLQVAARSGDACVIHVEAALPKRPPAAPAELVLWAGRRLGLCGLCNAEPPAANPAHTPNKGPAGALTLWAGRGG